VGLNARVNDNGFRNDGSYLYGEVIRAPHDLTANPDLDFRSTFRLIDAGFGRFARGERAVPALIDEAVAFVDAALRRGIHVVAFMPPYAPRVWARLRQGGFGYIDTIAPALRPRLAALGVRLFDFTDPTVLHMGDEAYVDGLHGSETVYLRLLEEMRRGDPVLDRFVDADRLQTLIRQTKNPLLVAAEAW